MNTESLATLNVDLAFCIFFNTERPKHFTLDFRITKDIREKI